MRLQAAVFQYVDARKKAGRFRGKSPVHISYCLTAFSDATGPDLDTSRLTKRHVQKWLEAQHELVGPSTFHWKFTQLRLFTAWLQHEGMLRSDPFRDLETPKKPDNLPRSLSPEQCEKLFRNLPDLRAELICSLIFQSALRVSEVASLEVGRIDFTSWVATITGKGDKERPVPIFEETQPILLAYLRQHPARSGPLIRSLSRPTKGITGPRISKLVSEWMYAAGIKQHANDGISAHAGRHTAATDTYEQSKDIRAVQQFLGHSSLSTTQIYVRGSVQNIRTAGQGRQYRR